MDTVAATPGEAVEERPAPPTAPQPPRPRRGRLMTVLASSLVAAVVAAVTTVALLTGADLGQRTASATAPQPARQAPVVASGRGASSWAASIAAAVGPSVAKVDVTTAQGQGEGSAVIYRSDGYLLTNNHVVANAGKVTVTLPDGKSYDATVVGTDPATDVGVIKIDATGLPAATLSSSNPRVGDEVLAIGTPFGLSGTVTEGIVSATGRTVDTSAVPLTNMLQTDAAINPGNSGGALVNSSGQVVGVNTAILSPSGTNNGIGFAIPITAARSIADQLIAHGSIEHGYLGIAGQTVDEQVASMYNLGVDHGAVAVQVQPSSPADAAGLQQGDIITAIDGHRVTSMPDLAGQLVSHEPGDEVTLQVYRQGRKVELTATLGTAPEQARTTQSPQAQQVPSLPTVP